LFRQNLKTVKQSKLEIIFNSLQNVKPLIPVKCLLLFFFVIHFFSFGKFSESSQKCLPWLGSLSENFDFAAHFPCSRKWWERVKKN
jgi:hypothetical protein